MSFVNQPIKMFLPHRGAARISWVDKKGCAIPFPEKAIFWPDSGHLQNNIRIEGKTQDFISVGRVRANCIVRLKEWKNKQ